MRTEVEVTELAARLWFPKTPIAQAVAALIGYAVWELLKIAIVSVVEGNVQVNVVNVAVCGVTFALLQVKKLGKLHPLVWIAAGACVGVVLGM